MIRHEYGDDIADAVESLGEPVLWVVGDALDRVLIDDRRRACEALQEEFAEVLYRGCDPVVYGRDAVAEALGSPWIAEVRSVLPRAPLRHDPWRLLHRE